MAELLVDFISSLDGYGAAEGWRRGSGACKDRSTSPGWKISRRLTTPS